MSAWLTIPSARPPAAAEPILAKWRKQGYKIAILRNPGECPPGIVEAADMTFEQRYDGYAAAVNQLVFSAIYRDPDAEWFVIGGDDIEPDPNHNADEIAAQCSAHFAGLACVQHRSCGCLTCIERTRTFGVCQPTGDRYAGGSIDRIAGSAWLGREFCKRINQGRGPLWPEYSHMFVDEELQSVAIKYGVFWQRPDLIQLHHHFMRQSKNIGSIAVSTPPPPHLEKWNTKEHWQESQALFKARQAAGFPGSEPTNER